MDIFAADIFLQAWISKIKGEDVSGYKIARLYIDSIWQKIADLIDSGISKEVIIGYISLSLSADLNVSRKELNNALVRKMKYERVSFKEVSKAEAVEKPLKASPVKKPEESPAVNPVETAKPEALPAKKPEESPTVKPVEAKTPAPAEPISAPAKVLPPIPPFKSSVVVQPPSSPAPQINRTAIENPPAPEISNPVHLDNKDSKEKPKPIFPAFYKLGTGFRGVDDVGPAAEAEKEIRRKVAASHKIYEEREKAKKLAAAEAAKLAASENSTKPKGQEND